ncbi:Uncharacterised protein [Chlamydia trachomatis]|nr:Uncharacterised protein [Chlamydia trachomatis]
MSMLYFSLVPVVGGVVVGVVSELSFECLYMKGQVQIKDVYNLLKLIRSI